MAASLWSSLTLSDSPPKRDGKAELEAQQAVFHALSHPARRQILQVLQFRGGTMTAGDIASRFSCSWPTTTRHLKVLREAGLVQFTVEGRERHYQLNAPFLTETVDAWVTWFRPKEI